MRDKMIWILLLAAFTGLLLFVVFNGKKAPQLPIGKTPMSDVSGHPYKIADFKGKVVVVSYFQSWCGECRAEVQELQALQQTLGLDKLSIVMISDEPWPNIDLIRNNVSKDFIFLRAKRSLREIGIRRFPTTYLLDRSGNVADAKVEGIHWNTPEIQQKILKLNQ